MDIGKLVKLKQFQGWAMKSFRDDLQVHCNEGMGFLLIYPRKKLRNAKNSLLIIEINTKERGQEVLKKANKKKKTQENRKT